MSFFPFLEGNDLREGTNYIYLVSKIWANLEVMVLGGYFSIYLGVPLNPIHSRMKLGINIFASSRFLR